MKYMKEKDMKDVDENLKMQRITKLLEMGGTMLAQSHDCGAPMFRYRGKVMCPVCDAGTEEQKKATEEPRIQTRPQEVRKEGEHAVQSRISDDNARLAAMTRTKVQEIAGSLENETDLHRTREKLECIELGIKILKMLES